MTGKDPESKPKRTSSSAESVRGELRQWYRGRLGQWLLEFERAEFEDVLSELFGYYLVQVGAAMEDYLLGASRIRYHVVLDESWPLSRSDSENGRVRGVYGNTDLLPLQNDSVDVVVLPHTLEFESSPHQVLREAERVLVSEGHVVILGFNPWSPWGVRRLAGKWRRQLPPWCGSFRSAMRIRDWLALLGFDVEMTRYGFFRPPIGHPGVMNRLQWLERLGSRWWPYLGGAYIIVARKQVVTLTPIRPRWRPRRRLIQPEFPKPTT